MLLIASLLFQLVYIANIQSELGQGSNSVKLKRIEFCDFRNHIGERVRTKFAYSGVEEYWGISSLDSCNITLGTEFDLSKISKLEAPLFWNKISKVHNKYWKYNLEVEAIGSFEIDSIHGYGHLSSNKANFVADRIVGSKLTLKKIAK